MTTVYAKDNKLARERVARYYRSKKTDIYQAYKKPSAAKVRAFYLIKQEMEKHGGDDLRITGANCNTFSCAYRLCDVLIYHTPTDCFEIYY